MIRRRGPATLIAAAMLLAFPATAAADDGGTLTVFAAASLREAFTEIGRAFERDHRASVRFEFAGADLLANQIAAGAPADVFASADERWSRYLRERGDLASAPRRFCRNRLVIIVPARNPGAVRSVADLAKPGLAVILEAPSVPLGRYARIAFARLSREAQYGPAFASRVERNVVSEEADVKAVATKIAAGEGDAGIVFATDVAPIAAAVRTIAMPTPPTPLASYPIATVKDGPAPRLAAAFVDDVLGPHGQAVLRRHGFLSPVSSADDASPRSRSRTSAHGRASVVPDRRGSP